MKGWAYENKKRGIRGSENKGNEEKGYPLDARAGPSILSQADLLCLLFFAHNFATATFQSCFQAQHQIEISQQPLY
jgi:hypothetical protein